MCIYITVYKCVYIYAVYTIVYIYMYIYTDDVRKGISGILRQLINPNYPGGSLVTCQASGSALRQALGDLGIGSTAR